MNFDTSKNLLSICKKTYVHSTRNFIFQRYLIYNHKNKKIYNININMFLTHATAVDYFIYWFNYLIIILNINIIFFEII